MKGKGVSEVENKDGWHGKALPADKAERAIAELGGERAPDRSQAAKPDRRSRRPSPSAPAPASTLPHLRAGREGRHAQGLRRRAGRARAARPDVVALDAEVSNSTHAEEFKKAYPDRFFEMYIAEQQMVAAAVGHERARLRAVRLDLRRLLQPRLRLHPHGRRSPRPTSACAARTPASRSARTARRRWRWKTWR